MENREFSGCQGFVEFMTGEMSDVDRKRFEHHMETCAVCREDAAEWRLVWDRLADEAPLHPLPADLKQEVMESIFDQAVPVKEHRILTVHKRVNKPLRWLAMSAALLLAFLAGFGWNEIMPKAETSVLPAQTATSQIEKLVSLKPVADSSGNSAGKPAYGVACLIRSDGDQRLVVYTFGSKQTTGESVYQVWLLNQGKRTSAGTFTVDASGIGVLTAPWSDQMPSFDAIGITLEPDATSMVPKGQKWFASV